MEPSSDVEASSVPPAHLEPTFLALPLEEPVCFFVPEAPAAPWTVALPPPDGPPVDIYLLNLALLI